ncbi:hypothetical protein CL633_03760 [bacterium]|nr:hypothetical protein [bacterium]|tara:strand:+ start:3171 stop:3806 length:636 start_codon:yes stop_codon:yes gene_type:complete
MNNLVIKNKISKIKKQIIKFLPWILICASLLLVLLLVWPNFNKVRTLRNNIKNTQDVILFKKVSLRDFEEIQKRYQNEETLDKIDQALPAEEDLPNLLVQIEALAMENGMFFSSIGFDSNKEKGNSLQMENNSNLGSNSSYSTTVITLDLLGTYENFKKYLGSIASNLRLMDVVEIGLVAHENKSDNLENASSSMAQEEYSFNLKIHVYYR